MTFVLDRDDNPHPRMLEAAIRYRRLAYLAPKEPMITRFWDGYLAAMEDATGLPRDRWLAKLERMPRAGCMFAVVPDVLRWEGGRCIGDAAATLARFEREHATVRDQGYRVAFVLQNGQEALPMPWELCDAVFIGGDTEWKLSHHALYLVWEAKARGLHVHMGRAGTAKRWRRAQAMQVDSLDGNLLKWPTANGPRLRKLLEGVAAEPQWALA